MFGERGAGPADPCTAGDKAGMPDLRTTVESLSPCCAG